MPPGIWIMYKHRQTKYIQTANGCCAFSSLPRTPLGRAIVTAHKWRNQRSTLPSRGRRSSSRAHRRIAPLQRADALLWLRRLDADARSWPALHAFVTVVTVLGTLHTPRVGTRLNLCLISWMRMQRIHNYPKHGNGRGFYLYYWIILQFLSFQCQWVTRL